MPSITVPVLCDLTAFQTIIQGESVSEAKRVLIKTVTQMNARRWNPGCFPSTYRTIKHEAESDLLAALNACGSMSEIKEALLHYKQQLDDVQHRIHPRGNTNAFMKGLGFLINQPSSVPVIIYTDIRGAMKKAGYYPNKSGMCYGVAWTALSACVRQSGQAYMERMQYLRQIDTLTLTFPDTDDTHQVYPFFDTVTLSMTNYTDMNGYKKGIGYPGRQEVAFPGCVIGSDEPGYQVPVVKQIFIIECTSEMLIHFLQQTRENNKGISFGVMINYTNHVISIGFDGNKWLAVNHDSHYYTETMGLLHTFLAEQSDNYKDGKMIASMEVVSGNGHSLDINNDAVVFNAKKSVSVSLALHLALQDGIVNVATDCITVISQQAYTPEILFELLTCKNARGIPGFYMALQNGHPDVITTFIQTSAAMLNTFPLSVERKAKLLCELLACENCGIPGFYMALHRGHSCAIATFIQTSAAVIAALALPEEQKAELLGELLACKSNDMPGFHMALKNDYSGAIIAFIQTSAAAVAALALPEERKAELLCELLACKRCSIPGLHIALHRGHSCTITVFIQTSAVVIGALALPEERKAELLCELLACKSNNVTGFCMALHKGHSGAIIAFIQESALAIAAFVLPEERKAELLHSLLVSKMGDGTPGFFMALQTGYPDVITAFIQESAAVISSFSLPKAKKAKWLGELLISKRRNGMPGFFMVLFYGCLDAITAFIQASAAAMTTISDLEEERAEYIYGLFHRMESDNKPKFLLALKQGGLAVKKVFAEGIDQLPLSNEQKETLKHPILASIKNTVDVNQ